MRTETRENNWNPERAVKWTLVYTFLLLAIVVRSENTGRMLMASLIAILTYWLISLPAWLKHREALPREIIFAKYGMLATVVTAATCVWL